MSTERSRRSRWVVGCLVVAASFLVPREQSASVGLAWMGASAPVQTTLAASGRFLGTALDGLSGAWKAAKENRQLRSEIADLKERLVEEQRKSTEREERLRMLAELADRGSELVRRPARLMGEGAGPQKGLVFIDKGSGSGVQRGMVVVAGRSVVGRVRAASASVSSVLLVTSVGSSFDGQVASTGERGIVAGNGDGTMRMKYVMKSPPRVGEAVVTAGRDGRTPRGLVLGLVAACDRQPGGLTYDVTLRPVRDLDRLDAVDAVRPAVSFSDLPGEPARPAPGVRRDE